MDAAMESRVREMEELISNGQFSEVETIWLEAVESGFTDIAAFQHLAELMTQAGQGDKAAGLLQLLIDPLMEDSEYEAACLVVNQAADAGPGLPSIKDSARKTYGERFKEVAGLDGVFDHAESAFGHNSGEFVQHIKERLSYKPGDYLYHDAGWGLGRVSQLDLNEEKLIVDFEEKPEHPVALKAVTEFFRKLPKDHLLARKAEDTAALKVMADERPADLIRCAMQSLEGKVNLRRVKDMIVPDVIAKSNWSKWWNGVKAEMSQRGTLRVIGSGTNPELELLHVPTTQEDEYADKAAACHTAVEMAQTLREYLDVSKEDATKQGEFLNVQLRKLFDLIATKDPIPVAEKILGKYLLEDVVDQVDGFDMEYPLDIKEIVQSDDSIVEALEGMGISAYEERLLKAVQEYREEWPGVYGQALLAQIPDSWDFIASTLKDAGEEKVLFAKVQKIYDHAYQKSEDGTIYPHQFMWLAPKIIVEEPSENWGLDVSPNVGLNELLRVGMDIFHRIERGERKAKQRLHLYRGVLAKGNNKLVREIVDAGDENTVKHLLQQIQTNRALSEARIETLSQIVFAKFPELAVASEPKVDLEDEELGEILTTPNGIQRKRQELNEILNVELPKVQKAIGEAIALGDVSENAELDAARAKEDVLRSQAQTLTADLDRARVVEQGEFAANVAGFGTTVAIKNAESGEVENYTILGRWDADSSKSVISDISAIGRGVKGSKAGDTVTFTTPDGKEVSYEIVSVEAAAAS